MNSEKSTISVRFRSDFAEILEVRAWYEGSRLGTLTNRLVRSAIIASAIEKQYEEQL